MNGDPPPDDAARAVLAIERALPDAVVKGDRDGADAVLSPRFVFTEHTGNSVDRPG